MKRKKLVPLIPILERMGACRGSIAWLRSKRHTTFADAWNDCPHSHWLLWIIAAAMDVRGGGYVGYCVPDSIHDIEKECGHDFSVGHHSSEDERILRARYKREDTERVLYNYAKREGLA